MLRSPDATDAFFQSGEIPHLSVHISDKGIQQLRKEARQYVRATVTDGKIVYTNVGVHLKGQAGSFRPVDDQPALTLHFEKFGEGQRFHGLEKIHLNNSVQDPSYMTELICGELFLASGVPATRASHAVVELNGRRLGLYVLKEGFDKGFLKRYFANPKGNMYDGGFLRDIDEHMERISGTEEGQPMVETLVKDCGVANLQERWKRMNQHLDVDRFVSFIAMEMMTWHWDGYLMKKNNYRVYCDPDSQRVVFFPHGMDQMFWNPQGGIYPGAGGMVADAFLAIPEGKTRFRTRAAELTTNVFLVATLTNRIREIHSRLRPVLASIDEESAKAHDNAVKILTRQITQRAAYLTRVLTSEEAKPVVFDAEGVATLSHWQSRLDGGDAQFRQVPEDGKMVLIIDALEGPAPAEGESPRVCYASYRTQVVLKPGHYAFVGRVQSQGIVPVGKSARGSGAGLRISQRSRKNGLVGDTSWEVLSYEFNVTEEQEEVELICDLRAMKGSARFEVPSLRLRRLEDPGK